MNSIKRLDGKAAAVRIIEMLRARGHQAFLVGGCVRDMLLGRTNPKDEYDVTTSARLEEVTALFRKTLAVGAKFGVVLVRMGGHWIEVASFRSDEGYTDGRHPDAVRIGTMQEDAERRDFTMNGLYYDPVEDKIIDLVDGRADIERRVIRAIGEPAARFREDHLRMLRAVRFAGQLTGFQIEEKTAEAIHSLSDKITDISTERILEELKKLLPSANRAHGLRLADELGLLKYILPQVHGLHGQRAGSFAPGFAGEALNGDAFAQTLAVMDRLATGAGLEITLAGLLHLVGWGLATELPPVRARMSQSHYSPSAQMAGRLCRQLSCSNDERVGVVWLVHLLPLLGRATELSLAQVKRLMLYGRFEGLLALYRARVEANLEPAENLRHIETLAARVNPADLARPPLITGDDLERELGLRPGPAFQKILDNVYDAQLNEEIQTRDEAIRLARNITA